MSKIPGSSSGEEGSPPEQSAAGQPLLRASSLRKVYRDGTRELEVLRGVNLQIETSQILAIIGASGSGKSTLLHLLGLLDRPTSGQIFYRGRELTGLKERERAAMRTREFGFVFQMFHLLPDLDAQENTMLPALIGPGLFGSPLPRSRAWKRSADLLARLGLAHRLRHRPSQLSGGEKQRVAIARALMNAPAIVFCDEPTGNLDAATSAEIYQLLLDLNREDRQTFVLVTHEMDLAARAHRVLRMTDGRLSSGDESAPALSS
ncbi:MAG: ABC transporter ATP-binding protein [Planctomycetes bacterium]|nr:ABC transporter ATP-binding protein [Planctomycetota bacterium]